MDYNLMIQLIGSMGFPIFMSIYLIRFMEVEQKDMRQTISDLRTAIDRLIERLGKEHED